MSCHSRQWVGRTSINLLVCTFTHPAGTKNHRYFHLASKWQCAMVVSLLSVLPGMVEGERLHWVLDTEAQARGISFAEAEAEFVS
jgi:hypothetical protein